jgi:hypothetical protein
VVGGGGVVVCVWGAWGGARRPGWPGGGGRGGGGRGAGMVVGVYPTTRSTAYPISTACHP